MHVICPRHRRAYLFARTVNFFVLFGLLYFLIGEGAALAAAAPDPSNFSVDAQHRVVIVGLPSGADLTPPASASNPYVINLHTPGETITVPIRDTGKEVQIVGVQPGSPVTPSESVASGVTITTITVGTPQNTAKGFCASFLVQVANCSFGVGELFLTRPDIKSAIVLNNVVHITQEYKREASVWFSFYVPLLRGSDLGLLGHPLLNDLIGKSDLGFWLGLQLASGSSSVFNSFGFGGAVSRPIGDGSTSFGFGIGYAWTQVSVLQDGFVDNAQAPNGATTVPLKELTDHGMILMAMFNF